MCYFLFQQAHSSVEKAGLIGLVHMRYIEADEKLSMRGGLLAEAIARDRDAGLLPFFVIINNYIAATNKSRVYFLNTYDR